jgi:hypothetical protein
MDKIICKACGKELRSADDGCYCDNIECPEFDMLVLAYESDKQEQEYKDFKRCAD